MADEPDRLHHSDPPRAADDDEVSPEVRLDLAEERLLHASIQANRARDTPGLDPSTEAQLRRRLGPPPRP